jgi:hypothetical protein
VYGWLKRNSVNIHEDGAEQSVGYLSAIVGRAPQEASNRFAEEHNASAKTTCKVKVLDLTALPGVLVG